MVQFALVATDVLCKEFTKLDRDGSRTHIFNHRPSRNRPCGWLETVAIDAPILLIEPTELFVLGAGG